MIVSHRIPSVLLRMLALDFGINQKMNALILTRGILNS